MSLLGAALGATWRRAGYQAEQHEAFATLQVAAESREAAGLLPSAAPALLPSGSETSEAADDVVVPPPADSSHAGETKGESFGPVPQSARDTDVVPRRADVEPPMLALDPALFARIEIPRLRMSTVVRNGVDDATLDVAVGHLPGTARPGEAGNVVLAGHRDTFFRPLRRIQLDDRIRMVVPGETYEYRVTSTEVVEPDAVRVLESNGSEELTLITCYPFRFIGPAPKRFIVKAERVE